VWLSGVDGDGLGGELVADRRVAERVEAHPDPGRGWPDVAPEDLADADLGRIRRLVAEADHPERDHVGRVVDRAEAPLEQPVARRVEGAAPLLLADDQPVTEMDLASIAAERPGEDPGLERGGADAAVELRAPRRLVGIDPQAQPAPDLVPRRRSLARAPLGQVVREPEPFVERRPSERVLDLELVAGTIEDRGRLQDVPCVHRFAVSPRRG
jgi:hypothetical protein